jgi:molybdenum cofactor biosynthesis enzyme MoaA
VDGHGSAAVAKFNQMLGRLRVSVTHGCQLHCTFCHREGIASHWQPIHMRPQTFGRLVQAFQELGGREVDVTGGDPLVHPQVGELLNNLAGARLHRALCTNGLLLSRVDKQLRRGYIDEIKLSVHASTDAIGKNLLGPAWSASKIEQALQIAHDTALRVTMNFSVTSENLAEFDAVLDKSLKYSTDLLVIDLISTKWNLDQAGLSDTSSSIVLSRLAQLGRPVGVTQDRTGCALRRFEGPDGQRWLIKDVRNGLFFTGMCTGCTVKANCGEGVFVLRIDSKGTWRPCLLREDLAEQVSLDDLSVGELRNVLSVHIDR